MRQQRRSPRAQQPPRRAARTAASSLLHGSALTRIRRDPDASFAVASLYLVVTLGLTEKWKAPTFAIDRNCRQGAPVVDLCTTTPWMPRTTPVSVTLVPGAIAGFGEGGCSERTATLNHAERRPSADATEAPPTEAVSCELPESDVTLSVFTRRDELRFTVASTTRPTAPTALPSV